MIVIDCGCASYGNADSLAWLAKEYRPSRIFGFDPQGETGYGWGNVIVDGVPCVLRQMAAWTYDGRVGFRLNENASMIDPECQEVPCFDLAKFVKCLGRDEIVLKLDVEGAEYQLLGHLIRTGADKRLDRILVEWHRGEDRLLLNALSCLAEEWTL